MCKQIAYYCTYILHFETPPPRMNYLFVLKLYTSLALVWLLLLVVVKLMMRQSSCCAS